MGVGKIFTSSHLLLVSRKQIRAALTMLEGGGSRLSTKGTVGLFTTPGNLPLDAGHISHIMHGLPMIFSHCN